MRSIVIFFAVSLSVAISDGRQFRCDYSYIPNQDVWMKLHRVPANWHEARLRCHLEGGNLASPTSVEYASAMKSFMKGLPESGVFTGIHATFSRGDFHSIEGVPLWNIAQPWAAGEPDNKNNDESCIAMQPKGFLADVSCDQPLPYICHKKLTNTTVFSSCGTTDPEYNFDSRTGSCYKFHRVPRTWSRAYMACSAEGGYLAIINSVTEAQLLAEIFAKNPANVMLGTFWKDIAFVGFQDWDEHGEWLTIHGQTLQDAGYINFSSGEPNNSTAGHTMGEYCGAIYRNALLNDHWCEMSFAFICEKSPDSLICDDEDTL